MKRSRSLPRSVLIIIPAYNEESSIANVIREVRSLKRGYDVVVVDDGSTDRTSEEAARAGGRVLRLPNNLGIGGAMQTGFRYAVGNNYDCVIQVDGDGQHPAMEIPALLAVLESDGADVVIGSRFLEKKGFQSTLSRRIDSHGSRAGPAWSSCSKAWRKRWVTDFLTSKSTRW